MVIALLTDFGLIDTYVGVVKGVILGIAPEAQVVDLSHSVAPQAVLEASVRLGDAACYFPAGTVFMVVVDPGVGTDRAVVIATAGGRMFVAPDNGVLTAVLAQNQTGGCIRVSAAADGLLPESRSATFHGRDVFAPIAAHLARSRAPSEFGEPYAIANLVRVEMPEPRTATAPMGGIDVTLTVLFADRFGNLMTNLTPAAWARTLSTHGFDPAAKVLNVTWQSGQSRWTSIHRTFGDVHPGQILSYWGSAGRLEIGIRNGSAASELGLTTGAEIACVVDQ